MRGIRQVTVYLRRRRACLRMASTFAANAAGSMIGVPRHGDIDSRSVSLDTRAAPPLSGQVEDQVVLVVGAVVNCPGHVSHDSAAAVPGRHHDGAQVSIDLRLGPFE